VNTGITVNDVVAETDGEGHSALNSVPLAMGSNEISVVLTTIDGSTTSKSVSVSRTAASPIRLYVQPDAGFAPFTALLTASTRQSGAITQVQVSNLGGGTFDNSKFDGETLGELSFPSPGMYLPTVTVTYGERQTYTQTVAVVVKDAAAMDRMFVGMFNSITGSLRTGQSAAALKFLTEPIRPAFEAVFNALNGRFPQIIETFTGFGGISLGNELATYAVRRDAGDITKIFLIEYMRDIDGVWRLDSW
jgi:hypothetical protein